MAKDLSNLKLVVDNTKAQEKFKLDYLEFIQNNCVPKNDLGTLKQCLINHNQQVWKFWQQFLSQFDEIKRKKLETLVLQHLSSDYFSVSFMQDHILVPILSDQLQKLDEEISQILQSNLANIEQNQISIDALVRNLRQVKTNQVIARVKTEFPYRQAVNELYEKIESLKLEQSEMHSFESHLAKFWYAILNL